MNTFRPMRNTYRPKNKISRGRGVVVLDRLHAKEPIIKGGDILPRPNVVGGIRTDRRGERNSGADLRGPNLAKRPSRQEPRRMENINGGSIENKIKIPLSIMNKKKNRNNIKLVL